MLSFTAKVPGGDSRGAEANRGAMRGALLLNGNISQEDDFVRTARAQLTRSRHIDSAVRDSLKVVLVTSGWLENEYQESHIKKSLYEIGIPSRPHNGFEGNVQNLSLYHLYQEFLDQRPELAEQWRQRGSLIESARNLYLEKNSFYTALLRKSLQRLREHVPQHSLARVWSQVQKVRSTLPTTFDGAGQVAHFIARDLQQTLQRLIENDDALVALLDELDEEFVTGTGLHYDEGWVRVRSQLSERILSANSVFLFGGHLGVLHRCLSFFRLREPLVEALRRGTCFYSVSAGSLLCCDRVIVYNDFDSDLGPRREFQLFGRGFGLVKHLQLFPHCMDRIQTDDCDNLAYLAQRFRSRTCVGLNERSFLLVEMDPHLCCTSVGADDGVYVFNDRGEKLCYREGQPIPVEEPD